MDSGNVGSVPTRRSSGKKIVLNGIPHDVIGVLPVVRVSRPDDRPVVPLASRSHGGTDRTNHFLEVYARLKPAVALERARADMDRVGAQLSSSTRPQSEPQCLRSPLAEDLPPRAYGLLLLLGSVVFVLLIACVNVANLLLASAASCRREMAVRAAVGAGRGRLIGQSLTESLLLGLLGGAAGLLVAKWAIVVIRGLVPGELPVLGVDRLGLDYRVLLFTFYFHCHRAAVWDAAGLASRQPECQRIAEGRQPHGGRVRRGVRLALVVGEIALASLLLVAAGLMLRSFQTLLRQETGITTDRVLTAFISLPWARYDSDEKRLAAFQEIERRLAMIPGVRSAGASSRFPWALNCALGSRHRRARTDT